MERRQNEEEKFNKMLSDMASKEYDGIDSKSLL